MISPIYKSILHVIVLENVRMQEMDPILMTLGESNFDSIAAA